MARLLHVVSNRLKPKLERRQLFLEVEESSWQPITMILQFNEVCLNCLQKTDPKSREQFLKDYKKLSFSELSAAMHVSHLEVVQNLSQLVPCVGCRHSAERLFEELASSEHPALYPIHVAKNKILSINSEVLCEPLKMYALLSAYGLQLNDIVKTIPKSKKNKRCPLHSIDTKKPRQCRLWEEVWAAMTEECKKEMVAIDSDALSDTVEAYLRKHRFCPECKSKVQQAFEILIGERDVANETGYKACLYQGIRPCCTEDGESRHIHVSTDKDFIGMLIEQAEPDIMGNRRERHAKTLDIAQEEVLTCVGIHLFERLHKVWQKMKVEEQSWQILLCLGLRAFHRKFQLALEQKQGVSSFELTCQQLCEEEEAQAARKQQRRQKKKEKRMKNKVRDAPQEKKDDGEKEPCKASSASGSAVSLAAEPTLKTQVITKRDNIGVCAEVMHRRDQHGEPSDCFPSLLRSQMYDAADNGLDDFCECEGGVGACDVGYSSGTEIMDDRSGLEENPGLEDCGACSETTSEPHISRDKVFCLAEKQQDWHNCHQIDLPVEASYAEKVVCSQQSFHCQTVNRPPGLMAPGSTSKQPLSVQASPLPHKTLCSLADLLENDKYLLAQEDTCCGIPHEDIQHYMDNKIELSRQRQVLRQRLQQKFNNLVSK